MHLGGEKIEFSYRENSSNSLNWMLEYCERFLQQFFWNLLQSQSHSKFEHVAVTLSSSFNSNWKLLMPFIYCICMLFR